jgi:RNA polymerase sigma-70 factor, ECF subfamily
MSALAVNAAGVPAQRVSSPSGSAGDDPAGGPTGVPCAVGQVEAGGVGAGAFGAGMIDDGALDDGTSGPGAVAGLGSGVVVADADQPLQEGVLRAAVAGDLRARERLLSEIHPLVLRYCRARLGRQETVIGAADDVAQEVCLAVVNALPGYTVRGLSFRAFVYGIAAHKVTDAFRAIGRNRAEPMADIPDAPMALDGPEHHLLQVELTERLGVLLHRLTSRQREVLVLRIAVGLSAEETAQIVGSTPGAVRVTQHRALNRLRRRVVTSGGEPADEIDEIDGVEETDEADGFDGIEGVGGVDGGRE